MSYRPSIDFPRGPRSGSMNTVLDHSHHMRTLCSSYGAGDMAGGYRPAQGSEASKLRSNDAQEDGHDLIPCSTCPKDSDGDTIKDKS